MAKTEFDPERFITARAGMRFVVACLVVVALLLLRSVWLGSVRESVFFLGTACMLVWLTRNRWAMQMRVGDPWGFRLDLATDWPLFGLGVALMAWTTFFW